ncbi:MAG: hypothetical protein B6D65_02575 [candidate division Zixibacteria bacterium 4484_93]|nr:MAG: hypothetical protein B6D65_02575 [candidate division Zixibacteria bacterium 4484_93]
MVAILVLLVFLAMYIIIATERMNKTTIALFVGTLFALVGVLKENEPFQFVDWNVIFLLAGMMVIVNITSKSGLFEYIAISLSRLAGGRPLLILIFLSLATAFISMFLDNVTTVLLMCPISILIAERLEISYVPYLLSEVIASNIGGTATLIGDPPNIIIGSAAGLSFISFILNLAPVVLIILAVFAFNLYLKYRKQLRTSRDIRARILSMEPSRAIQNRPLMWKSLFVLSLVLVGFLLHDAMGVLPSVIALFGAMLLLIISGEDVGKALSSVEWTTLFFFIGLFMVVGALEKVGVIEYLGRAVLSLTHGRVGFTSMLILWFSAAVSGIIDNIPYTAAMVPLIKQVIGGLSGVHVGNVFWWSLALGSCLGGNATAIGASANVLVVDLSKKYKHPVSFLEFARFGIPVVFESLVISSLYIYFRYLMHI